MTLSDVPRSYSVQLLLRARCGQRAAGVLSACLDVAVSLGTVKRT